MHSPPLDPRNLVGKVLGGRYVITERLGSGGMGIVYLAEQKELSRNTAIKVLLPEDLNADSIARFKRGARNASRISHDNVCRVFDYAAPPDGLQYLAMEYVEGKTLSAVLMDEDRKPLRLSLLRSADIINQTASGVQAAHDLGIVHRDLKPGNIMLTRAVDGRDHVTVVDFDIAKGRAETGDAELTQMNWVIGTPKYMSPEQHAGEEVDDRSDTYSLGLIFFRMLTGRSPFSATTAEGLLIQKLTVEPASLSEAAPDLTFPIEIQAVIGRALRRDPEQRWRSVAEFGAAALAGCEPSSSLPVEPSEGAPAAQYGFDRRGGASALAGAAPPVVESSLGAAITVAATQPVIAAQASSRISSLRALMYATATVVTVAAVGWGINAQITSEGRLSNSPREQTGAPPQGATPILPPDTSETRGDAPDLTITTVDGPQPDLPVEAENPVVEPLPPPPEWTVISARARLAEIDDTIRDRAERRVEVPDSLALVFEIAAREIYEAGLGDAELQAHSAAVLARALGYLGRWDDAFDWISTAVRLDSSERRYATLLTQIQNNR